MCFMLGFGRAAPSRLWGNWTCWIQIVFDFYCQCTCCYEHIGIGFMEILCCLALAYSRWLDGLWLCLLVLSYYLSSPFLLLYIYLDLFVASTGLLLCQRRMCWENCQLPQLAKHRSSAADVPEPALPASTTDARAGPLSALIAKYTHIS